jgi:hypothetical protein
MCAIGAPPRRAFVASLRSSERRVPLATVPRLTKPALGVQEPDAKPLPHHMLDRCRRVVIRPGRSREAGWGAEIPVPTATGATETRPAPVQKI